MVPKNKKETIKETASFANRRAHGLLLEPYRPATPIGTDKVGGDILKQKGLHKGDNPFGGLYYFISWKIALMAFSNKVKVNGEKKLYYFYK